MGKLRLAIFVLIVLAVPGSLLIQRAVNGDDRVDPLIDGAAPEFSLPALDGDEVALDDVAGKPLVIHFWGSWCEPCDFHLDVLAEARQRHPDVNFVGILFRDDPGDARRFARAHDADWPMLVDADEDAASAYGVASVPVTFFVGRDGTIAGSMVNEYSKPLLERQLRRIL